MPSVGRRTGRERRRGRGGGSGGGREGAVAGADDPRHRAGAARRRSGERDGRLRKRSRTKRCCARRKCRRRKPQAEKPRESPHSFPPDRSFTRRARARSIRMTTRARTSKGAIHVPSQREYDPNEETSVLSKASLPLPLARPPGEQRARRRPRRGRRRGRRGRRRADQLSSARHVVAGTEAHPGVGERDRREQPIGRRRRGPRSRAARSGSRRRRARRKIAFRGRGRFCS